MFRWLDLYLQTQTGEGAQADLLPLDLYHSSSLLSSLSLFWLGPFDMLVRAIFGQFETRWPRPPQYAQPFTPSTSSISA